MTFKLHLQALLSRLADEDCDRGGSFHFPARSRILPYPVPLIEKRRGFRLSPGGRFPPGFIHNHRVIIITRLNKLYECMFSP